MPIREMTEADLPQVLALQRELAFQDWNEKQFVAEIRANYALCLVYIEDPDSAGNIANTGESRASLLGYAIFHLMGQDSELLSIAASPKVQRTGIGSALMETGFAKLDFSSGDQVFLEVREGNAKARAFYEKHGFKPYSTRKKYYADGENAVLYKR